MATKILAFCCGTSDSMQRTVQGRIGGGFYPTLEISGLIKKSYGHCTSVEQCNIAVRFVLNVLFLILL